MKFTFYADPGHGWLRVSKSLLERLAISSRISNCSYQRGDYAYLEEDCDAAVLVNTLRDRGVKVEFRERHTNRRSKIRGYSRYTA